jgi:hypothetical protein
MLSIDDRNFGEARDTAEGWIENPWPVSRKTALNWVAEHGEDLIADFLEEHGKKDSYCSREVFLWLGY